MSKKPFRLEQLLTHKKRIEEAMQVRLAKLREEHQQQRFRLEEIRSNRDHEMSQLAQRQHGRLDVGEVQSHIEYLEVLKHHIHLQGELVGQLAGQVSESRERLVAVLQEKKALEQLKEQERLRAEATARHADAQMIDEITMARFAREQRKEAS